MKFNVVVPIALTCLHLISSSSAEARYQSRHEAPITTLLNNIADSSGKTIVSSFLANESVPDSTILDELKFKQFLDTKGMAWIEYEGLVRIVPKVDITRAQQMLRDAAANNWCKSMSTNTVNTDFPEPTDVKDIIKAMALWSGTSTIVPDSVQGKVRIVREQQVSLQRACQFWLAALAQVGFKAVYKDGLMVILAESANSRWQWPKKEVGESKESLDFDFGDQTDVAKIVERYSQLTGEKLKLAAGVKRQAAVIMPRKVLAGELSRVFRSTLRSTGLTTENGVVRPM